MKYNKIKGIEVSKLCFGGLTVGPLQKNLSYKEGGAIIDYAFFRGVNFIDTAELYETYGHLREALKNHNRNNIVIATKSYAYDKITAERSIKKALEDIGTDYLDMFLLHEQESVHTIRGHYEALETLYEYKKKGIIRAVGLSTHFVEGVHAAYDYSLDVIHPILNKNGLGIVDGNRDEMEKAIKRFKEKGGVYSMKPLGGGNLLGNIDECFDYILNLDYIESIAVGMQSKDEVDYNIKLFSGEQIPYDLKNRLKNKTKTLHIADWCVGCNNCIKVCHQNALKKGNKKPIWDKDKCVLCGYCASVCKDFCIKVI